MYGEIIVNSNLRIGDIINKNDIIGKIMDGIILRKVSKDGNPTVTRDAYDGMS